MQIKYSEARKRKLFLLISLLFLFNGIKAQHNRVFLSNPGCGTHKSDTGYYMKNAAGFLSEKMAARTNGTNTILFQTPYLINVFIRIFSDDDGNNQACTAETAIQNLSEMNVQYAGHNVCFQLVDIDYINDTYANNMVYDSLLDTDYKSYLKNNYARQGGITIFVHNNFVASGSSGNAYGIPNNFLSIAGWAINAANVHSIFAHEMGHCLGLYHTFEAGGNGALAENVARSGSCKDCDTDGDLCCDTPADYWNSWAPARMSACTYIGTVTDNCNNAQYNPSTNNIMSYMPWECISFTSSGFTGNQQTRIHATVNDSNGPVYSSVMPDAVIVTGSNVSSGFIIKSGRNSVVTSGTGTYAGDAKTYITSYENGYITISPGFTFKPDASTGLTDIKITTCQ